MTRQSLTDQPPSPAANEAKPLKIRIELSVARFCVYCFFLFAALSWMFAFGILVGRGIPQVSSEETSYKADFMRFLGLGRESEPVPENPAETWENPKKTQEDQKKILQSLNYYEDLTQKSIPVPETSAADPTQLASPAPEANSKQVPADSAKQKSKSSQRPAQESAPPAETAKPSPPTTVQEVAPPPRMGEHFTLLIASLRDMDNAQKLVEQLKSKGYPARMESIDLNGGGRWNRVMVGSFDSRDGAMRFAAEFNRKERTEGLVIREAN
ncbi:MAG: SPOR domain-containing protein [Syntrophobacteraceae bacterium]|nr:SPOR domain-containing protein [Desulfobacteraceae bacterium]